MKEYDDKRRRDLAKIHLAKRQLGMDDDTYRLMLANVAGVTSAADLDAAGRQAVLDYLIAKGFIPFNRFGRSTRGSPQARLIYYLWGSLVRAGAVQSMKGLSGWLMRNTRHWHPRHRGWKRPESLPSAVASRVIEQLKLWLEREGAPWR